MRIIDWSSDVCSSDLVERCRADLTHYQNAADARKYTDTVQAVLRAERALYPEAKPALALLVARMLHKLMAYKDEYEVARLFTNGEFRQTLRDRFEGDFTLKFHLAPPLLAKRDPRTGIARKMTFGPGMEKRVRETGSASCRERVWCDV